MLTADLTLSDMWTYKTIGDIPVISKVRPKLIVMNNVLGFSSNSNAEQNKNESLA